MVAPESRRHPRHPFSAELSLETVDGTRRQVSALNLSLSGLFIRTLEPPPVGSVVRVLMPTPGDPQWMNARVMRVVDRVTAQKTGQVPGAGLHFVDCVDGTQQALGALIATLPPSSDAPGPAAAGPQRLFTPTTLSLEARRYAQEGRQHMEARRWSRAEVCFSRAVALEPHLPQHHVDLAWASANVPNRPLATRVRLALETLSRLAAQHQHADALYKMALVYRMAGDAENAEAFLRRTLLMDRTHAGAAALLQQPTVEMNAPVAASGLRAVGAWLDRWLR